MSDNPDATQSSLPLAATPLFGFWTPISEQRPVTYEPVLVWGVLENEPYADSHEGYWDGRKWKSIRDDEFADADSLRKLNIAATHWMPRPGKPNAATLARAAQGVDPATD